MCCSQCCTFTNITTWTLGQWLLFATLLSDLSRDDIRHVVRACYLISSDNWCRLPLMSVLSGQTIRSPFYSSAPSYCKMTRTACKGQSSQCTMGSVLEYPCRWHHTIYYDWIKKNHSSALIWNHNWKCRFCSNPVPTFCCMDFLSNQRHLYCNTFCEVRKPRFPVGSFRVCRTIVLVSLEHTQDDAFQWLHHVFPLAPWKMSRIMSLYTLKEVPDSWRLLWCIITRHHDSAYDPAVRFKEVPQMTS